MANPTKSRAVVLTGPGQTDLEELSMPKELNGGALGQVLAAGICGSDLTLYYDGPLGRRLWPLILGHENIVRIVQIDEGFAKRWEVKEGDRVAIEEFIPCGHCPACLKGFYRRCPGTDYNSNTFLRYGRTPLSTSPGLWGGFSEFIYIHPDAIVHHVPASIPDRHAPLFVPFANGIRWVSDVGRANPGETVVILGPGAHGLGCVVAAKEVGASKIIVVGLSTDSARLKTALSLGATHTLFADIDNVQDSVKEITGTMADVVIEVTAGSKGAPKLAAALAAPGGRVVLAGGATSEREGVSPEVIIRNELTVNGVRGHDLRSIIPAISVLGSGRYDLDSISTTVFPLHSAGLALESFASSDPERPVAYVVEPTESTF